MSDRTMLIYAKAPLFLWAEAVATVCYTQNRSIIRLRHGKTPYDILHDKPPDLSFLHIFGALCYPTNDSENLDFDELTAMAFEYSSLGPALHEMTPATITAEVIALVVELVAPEPTASIGSPSSTIVDQDAPSPSNSQTTPEIQSPIIPNDFEEDNHDLAFIQLVQLPDHKISEHNSKWTKDHALKNIIGELARPVSTRLQLHEQALFYYYDDFLTTVKPKTYKDALTLSCWIEAMQEELNEFERLEV
ncbi:hypothetical protein Tco_0152011 [Tanacetum coccineum]